jgi:hypothetical protein
MEFKIASQDPFGVLSSTKPIVESLRYIKIHEENLDKVTDNLLKILTRGIGSEDMDFGKTGNLKDDIQLVFLEDTVNFCFWAEKGKEKWTVEWPKGRFTDGWYALTACFQRALSHGKPILNADYFENLSLEEARLIFSSSNTAEIPLLEERRKNLREAGKVLREKYSGEFINVLEEGKFDAINIVKNLVKNFPSFRDIFEFKNKEIFFLKRAQLCVLDLSYLNGLAIKNIDALSGFADYKVPQMLRKFGIISFNSDLGSKIDNFIPLPMGEEEEIEIRSATIWCIELIRQKLGKFSPGDIDNALWIMSQDKTGVSPYHRTYSIYY